MAKRSRRPPNLVAVGGRGSKELDNRGVTLPSSDRGRTVPFPFAAFLNLKRVLGVPGFPVLRVQVAMVYEIV